MNLYQLFGHTSIKESPYHVKLQLNDSVLNIPLRIFVIFSVVPNQDQMLVHPVSIYHIHNELIERSKIFEVQAKRVCLQANLLWLSLIHI